MGGWDVGLDVHYTLKQADMLVYIVCACSRHVNE